MLRTVPCSSSMADAVFVTLSARQLNPNLYIITRADDQRPDIRIVGHNES